MTSPARTPAEIGRSNRRNGAAWQHACARWLRENGFPGAEYQLRHHVGDIIGTGDISVEATRAEWDKIGPKMTQAANDAARRGLPWYCVWKKRIGKTSPADGWIVTPASVFWSMAAELDRLQGIERALSRLKGASE